MGVKILANAQELLPVAAATTVGLSILQKIFDCPMVNDRNPGILPIAKRPVLCLSSFASVPVFYVGKTIQEYWRRAYRHIVSMETCNPSLSLGRHVTDRIHPGMRRDWNKSLLQLEQRMIFRLNATQAPGLNGASSFRPFLEGFTSGGSEWESAA